MTTLCKYLLLTAAVSINISCDGKADQQTSRETDQQSTTNTLKVDSAKADQDTEDGTRVINIVGTDQMKFVVKDSSQHLITADTIKIFNEKPYLLLSGIKAEPGEQIRIRLKTLSRFEASMMSHNWVLLQSGVDPQAFVNAANREQDFLPSEREDEIIAHTELAADGETVEITFKAPEKLGRYVYLCSFMAHFAAGMKGELIVE